MEFLLGEGEGDGLVLVVGWGCIVVVVFILVGVVIVGWAVDDVMVVLGNTGKQAPLYGRTNRYCRKDKKDRGIIILLII